MLSEESEKSTPDFVPESDPPKIHYKREGYIPLEHGRDSPKVKTCSLNPDTGEIVEIKKIEKKEKHWLRV